MGRSGVEVAMLRSLACGVVVAGLAVGPALAAEGVRTVVPCTTDSDCARKNGGDGSPYPSAGAEEPYKWLAVWLRERAHVPPARPVRRT